MYKKSWKAGNGVGECLDLALLLLVFVSDLGSALRPLILPKYWVYLLDFDSLIFSLDETIYTVDMDAK